MHLNSVRAALLRSSILASGLVAAGLAGHARAAEQQAQAPGVQEEIVVTGSRIARPGFVSPTPMATLTEADLQTKAPGNLTEIQQDLPQLLPNLNTNQQRTIPGQANADLRGLGANRTLTLLNGERLPPTTPVGTVDISIIPTALVRRIDVVTGGASAAYGSDAVAGVVNVFLDEDFTGFRSTFQTGITKYGDNQNYLASLAYGDTFAGERGHVFGAVEWYENLGQQRTGSRPWGRGDFTLITDPSYVAGNTSGITRFKVVGPATYANITDGGVITNVPVGHPLRGIQFGANGEPMPFRYGQYWTSGGVFAVGGDGAQVWSQNINLAAYQQRYGGLAGLTYEVTPDITFFANGIYSKRTGNYTIVPNYNNGDITIQRDNAFLPPTIRTIMTNNNIASFRMGRSNVDIINPDSDPTSGFARTDSGILVYRVLGGLRGETSSTWSWDFSAQYAHTDAAIDIKNDRINANWTKALDSVLSPTTGLPVCRVNANASAADDDPACVPANVFGPNSVSPAVARYVYATAKTWADFDRYAAAANLRGEPFDLFAGPVSVAAGAEFRSDKLFFTGDPISQAAGYRVNNQSLTEGKNTVVEGYAETVVPVLAGAAMAQSLEFNGAVRVTHYSDSGTVATYKVGTSYTPVDDIRFRGTYSRDIRAPSLFDLYSGQRTQPNNVVDRFNNTTVTYIAVSGGEPTLQPEKGTTYTVGAVYQPEWLDRFQISLDYYRIRLVNSISAVGAQQTVDNCFAGLQNFCGKIVRDSAGVITTIYTTAINAGESRLKGFDLDAAYSMPLGDGDLTLHALANYVIDDILINTNGGVVTAVDSAGTFGSPHWRTNFTASYRLDKLNAQIQYRWIQGGTRNATYVEGVDISAAENKVAGQGVVHISAGYDITENVQVFGKIENLFDKDPPLTVGGGAIGNEQAGGGRTDRLGQRFSLGARVKF